MRNVLNAMQDGMLKSRIFKYDGYIMRAISMSISEAYDMRDMRPQTPLQLALTQAPKKALGIIGAAASFAVLGVINTFSFVVNKTADVIAWTVNDKREESWAPVITAMITVIYLAYVLLARLLQEEVAQNNQEKENITFTSEQMQNAIQAFSKMQNTTQASTAATTFSAETQKMFRGMFAQKPSPKNPPSKNSPSKNPPPKSAEDALFDEVFAEMAKPAADRENAVEHMSPPPSPHASTRPTTPSNQF